MRRPGGWVLWVEQLTGWQYWLYVTAFTAVLTFGFGVPFYVWAMAGQGDGLKTGIVIAVISTAVLPGVSTWARRQPRAALLAGRTADPRRTRRTRRLQVTCAWVALAVSAVSAVSAVDAIAAAARGSRWLWISAAVEAAGGAALLCGVRMERRAERAGPPDPDRVGSLDAAARAGISELVTRGQYMHAVCQVRELTGLDLPGARAVVESLRS